MRNVARTGAWIVAPIALIAVISPLQNTGATASMTPVSGAGFDDGQFTGWSYGSQTGTLGPSIQGNGSGVNIFSGPKTFNHSQFGAVGSPTKQDGSPNPYYAAAVPAGSWTFSPNNGTYAALLQPAGQQNFNQAVAELGLGATPIAQLKSTLTTQASASGFGQRKSNRCSMDNKRCSANRWSYLYNVLELCWN